MNFEKSSYHHEDRDQFQGSQESNETLEFLIDSFIKYSIVNSAEMINEGNNGVISTISLSDLPPEMSRRFYGEDDFSENSADGQFAMKTLKVYAPHAGEHEANMHRRANQLLAESGQNDKLAKIPKLYYYKELNLKPEDEELKKKLETDGIDISSGKFDVMIMDYVKGDDFSSYILKQVIKYSDDQELLNDPELIELRERLKSDIKFEHLDFSFLYDTVHDLLGLKAEDCREYGPKMQVEKINHEQITKFLKGRKFQLDKAKFDGLINTIDLLNKNDFYHRDLHLRNIMVDYDEQGNINDYYLLDFGTAVDLSGNNYGKPYIDGDSHYVPDPSIIGIYSSLKEGALSEPPLISNLNKLLKNMKNSPRVSETDWEELEQADNIAGLRSAINKISGLLFANSLSWEAKGPLILEASKNNKKLALELIENNFNKENQSFRNHLQALKNYIEKNN